VLGATSAVASAQNPKPPLSYKWQLRSPQQQSTQALPPLRPSLHQNLTVPSFAMDAGPPFQELRSALDAVKNNKALYESLSEIKLSARRQSP
jgi:hypothetical protein